MTHTNDLIALINEAREDDDMIPLSFNPSLARAAIQHSLHMYKTGILSHTGSGNSSFSNRINNNSYIFSEAAENIAYCNKSAQNAFDIWMQSDNHRANFLNPAFCHIGVGIAPRAMEGNKVISLYWTVTLASPLYFEDVEEADADDDLFGVIF